MPPAARVTDVHTCPMHTGSTPHVGGPLLAPGSRNVNVEGKPLARTFDRAHCNGSPPAIIASGSGTVRVNMRLAARVGDQTSGGGFITTGASTVRIGGASQLVAAVCTEPTTEKALEKAQAAQQSAAQNGLQCEDYSAIPKDKSRVAIPLTDSEYAQMEQARKEGGPAAVEKEAIKIAEHRARCGFRHIDGDYDPKGAPPGPTGIVNGARIRSYDENGEYTWEYTAVDHYREYSSLRDQAGMVGAAIGHGIDTAYDSGIGQYLWKLLNGDTTTVGTDGDHRPPAKYDPRVEAAENCGLAGEPLERCRFEPDNTPTKSSYDPTPIDPKHIPAGYRESGPGTVGDIKPGARNAGQVTYRPDGRPIHH